MSLGRITDKDRFTTELQTQDLRIVSLDLAQLVHELELMDPDISGTISGGQLLAVVRDPDAANTVPLIVRLLTVPIRVGRIGLLDVVEVGVDVNRLQELVRVDVPLVHSVGGHVVIHVPDPDGVVGAARDE